MKIGVPKETKKDEYRVAILPVGVEELVRSGHTVTLQKTAGSGSGLPDSAYEECGATIVNTAPEVFASSDLIVKVKEPQKEELLKIKPNQIIFTFLSFHQSFSTLRRRGGPCHRFIRGKLVHHRGRIARRQRTRHL